MGEGDGGDADALAELTSGVDKWACLNCPGGCGKTINLALNPTRRPRWSVETDIWQQPTVQPSVHQLNECGCHFWIKSGRIEWCKGGRPHEALPMTDDLPMAVDRRA